MRELPLHGERLALGETFVESRGGRANLLRTTFFLPRGGGSRSRCWSGCRRRGDPGSGAGPGDAYNPLNCLLQILQLSTGVESRGAEGAHP